MDFDGPVGKEGVGIGIWIHILMKQSGKIPPNIKCCSYNLSFNYSNNESKYEALIVRLKMLKKLGAQKISVYGDFELIINQVKRGILGQKFKDASIS